jgi:ribosomal protein L13E
MAHRDDGMFKVTEGPLAVIRQCLHCKHHEVVRKGRPGVGRGYGMREGNKARGRMIQHVKTAHPAEYAAAIEAAKR